MLDNPFLLTGAFVAGSSAISFAMAKFSPTISAPLRHIFAGGAPLGVVFANLLEGKESVALYGTDLAFGGALFALGAGASILVSKVTKSSEPGQDLLR